MRKLTANDEGLLGSYLDFASLQAARLNVTNGFLAELRALWAEGKGPIPAGLSLLKIECDAGNKEAAAVVIDRLLARHDASDAWLQISADELEKARFQDLLIRVQERLSEINPLNEQNALNLARSLRETGRKEAAALSWKALRSVLRSPMNWPAKVADGFAQAGELKRAAVLFAQGHARRSLRSQFRHAHPVCATAIPQGDLPAAKKTLRFAFTNPGNAKLRFRHRLDCRLKSPRPLRRRTPGFRIVSFPSHRSAPCGLRLF